MIVGFYVEHAYGLYTAIPFIRARIADGDQIVLLTGSSLNIEVQSLGINVSKHLSVNGYESSFLRMLTSLFEIIFVGLDFSESYSHRKRLKWKKYQIYISRISRPLKIPKRSINKFYTNLFSIFINFWNVIDLEVDEMYAFTKVSNPYLMIPFRKKLTLVTESWDHPVKEPYFIDPYRHVVWNSGLLSEVQEYQGCRQIEMVNAPKFEYRNEFRDIDTCYEMSRLSISLRHDIDMLINGNYLVYPMCTSSKYFGFTGEIDFIRALSEILRDSGFSLYIRPYPLAPTQDRGELEKMENVIIGNMKFFPDGLDVLDRESRLFKYLILKKCTAIINVGTTFALDGAVVGTPIFQLRLEDDEFGEFSQYSRGYHIKRHLWTNNSIKYTPHLDFLNCFKRGIPQAFATEVRKWIFQR